MKLKALVMTLVIAALGVSVAAATASPNHGKPPRPSGDKPAKPAKGSKHADACRGPQIMLRGTFVSGSADSTGAGSFAMVIAKTNHPARRLGLLAGSQVSIKVDARTKYRRHGHASLADLLANDRLSVKARACRTDQTPPSGDGSGTGSGSDQPSNPAPTKGKGHGKRHGAVAAPASFTLIARKVDAHPPRPPKDGGDGTTTGDTGTTGTTTDQEDTGTTDTTGTTTGDGSSS